MASIENRSRFIVTVQNREDLTQTGGLAKNTAQLYTLFGFANLLLARRSYCQRYTQVAS